MRRIFTLFLLFISSVFVETRKRQKIRFLILVRLLHVQSCRFSRALAVFCLCRNPKKTEDKIPYNRSSSSRSTCKVFTGAHYISGLILGLGLAAACAQQNLPEFPPSLSEPQVPLSLEEILPEKIPIPAETEEATSAEQRKMAELDKLFGQLRRTVGSDDAARISRQIHGIWAQSGSETVDLLMQWAEKAIEQGDFAQAMDFLDNVVMLKPEFAEGWMRRASVHLQRHDLILAMLDLNQVLQLEPRHYQAMAQLGRVMEMTERKSAALAVYAQALTLYPQFVRLQKRLDNLLYEVSEQSL